MIARCKTEQDILRSIDFAHEHELEMLFVPATTAFLDGEPVIAEW